MNGGNLEQPSLRGKAGGKERIAKVLARAGIASRRESEKLIAEGRVVMNGTVVTHPATLANANDAISVDGRTVAAATHSRLWRYHKPAGLVTTARDPEGRPTVFAALPKDLPRVVSVGRLDINTEGLLLLTNDGELARFLEHPVQGLGRSYRVRAHGHIDDAAVSQLRNGITVDGVRYRPIEITLERRRSGNIWLSMTLREGKNREIKKLLAHFGLQVTRLIRTSYGPFQLGNLAPGATEEVSHASLQDLRPVHFRKAP
jgi:23S rRNA pseudouridine2605 synthase